MALSMTRRLQTPPPASRQSVARHHQGSMPSIHDRPKTIESRSEAGHWEGDLIICKCHSACNCSSCTRALSRQVIVPLAARLTGKTCRRNHLSDARGLRPASILICEDRITFDNDTAFAQHGLLQDDARHGLTAPGFSGDAYAAHGKKAASKTPMDAYADGCRAASISTAHPTGKSRRSFSRPTSRPVNASGSRRLSKPCLPNLERMSKSASLNLVALRAGIQVSRVPRIECGHSSGNRSAAYPRVFWFASAHASDWLELLLRKRSARVAIPAKTD